jgi:hypothetical protein
MPAPKISAWLKSMDGKPEEEVFAGLRQQLDESDAQLTARASEAYKMGDMHTVREMGWFKDQNAKMRASMRRPTPGAIFRVKKTK